VYGGAARWGLGIRQAAAVVKRGTISLRRISKNYSETHLPATILPPPQVFLREPPSSVGLDLILSMF